MHLRRWLTVALSLLPATVQADAMFGPADLAEIGLRLESTDCERACALSDFVVEQVAFPPGTPPERAAGRRLLLAAGVPGGDRCGAGRCHSAYILRTSDRLIVLREGLDLGRASVLSPDEIPGDDFPPQRYHSFPLQPADGSGSVARTLRETHPTVHAELLTILGAETAVTALAVEVLELVVWLAQSPEGNRLLLDPLRVNGTVLLNTALANPGAALGHAALGVGAEIVEGAAVSVAAALIVDSMFMLPGFDRISPAWQQSLRPVLHAAVVETLNLLRAGTGDPTALVAPLVNRAVDVYRIAWASRSAARAQDDALTAMAISIETAVQLVTLVPGPRSSAIASETIRAATADVRSIVGRDDETAVIEIVNLTFVALMAQARGDQDRARSLARQILEKGRTSGNITPFSAVLRPVDWLTAVARQDYRDSPEQAAIIMINATRLRELFEPTPAVASSGNLPEAPPPLPQTDTGHGVVLPIVGFTGEFSRGFYDPRYPSDYQPSAQHLGVDLPSPVGTIVVSPVPGQVVHNGTRASDPFNKYLVIRDSRSGLEHVLGHIDSTLEEGATVNAGDRVGTIVRAGTGPHLHWGVNRRGVLAAMDVHAGWGFGRAPVVSTPTDATARGWIDPASLIGSVLAPSREGELAAAQSAAPPPAPAESSVQQGAAWYARIVTGGRISGYTHGQFPSLGNRTHAGVDIGGGCGLPVMAAADGEVAAVLAYGDGRLDALGHAVLLRHPPEGDRPVSTLYLHLQDRPALSVGQTVAAGQEIGRTGATGAADSCHLHFEVRHFDGWLYPLWNNIYGPGDWRETPEFRVGWTDPEEWITRGDTHLISATQTSDTPNGTWTLIREARSILRPGQSAGDVAVGHDGGASYRGDRIFPAVHDPADIEVRIFPSLDMRKSILFHWDQDWGGLRAAVIDFERSRIVKSNVIPETAVRGVADLANVRQPIPSLAWSPDGRYVALPIQAKEWQSDLLLIDTETGNQVVLDIDDIAPDEWAFPKMETLRSDGESWITFHFDILACANPACTHPQISRSVEASFRIDTLSEARLPNARESRNAESQLLGPHSVIATQHESYDCLRANGLEEFAGCLRAAGEGEQAVRAAIAMSDKNFNRYLIDYLEMGPIDIAVLQWPAAGLGITQGFVKAGFEFLPVDEQFAPMNARDAASLAIALSHPRADALNYTFVVGHRYLAVGAQRFVVAALLTDGCRACDVVATAIGYVDFHDGSVVSSSTIGWAAQYGQFPTSDEEVRRRLNSGDAREIQTQLNLRGYVAGPMDGIFGSSSRAALAEFQREYCLPESGRIDRATAAALVDADRFAPAPCAGGPEAGAGLLPIAPGTFAFDDRQCTEDEATWEELLAEYGEMAYLMVYWFGENEIHVGASQCRVLRANLTGGKLSVSAQCLEEGMGPFQREMTFDNVGRHSFSKTHHEGEDFTFRRCDIPEHETRVAELRPGIYFANLALCGNYNIDHYQHLRIIGPTSVVFGWETGCMIDRHNPVAEGTQYFGLCREGVQAFAGEWQWRVEGSEQFVEVRSLFAEGSDFRNGLRFMRCPGD